MVIPHHGDINYVTLYTGHSMMYICQDGANIYILLLYKHAIAKDQCSNTEHWTKCMTYFVKPEYFATYSH